MANILVLDSNHGGSIITGLSEDGHHISAAESFEEVLQAIQLNAPPYDLLIMEWIPGTTQYLDNHTSVIKGDAKDRCIRLQGEYVERLAAIRAVGFTGAIVRVINDNVAWKQFDNDVRTEINSLKIETALKKTDLHRWLPSLRMIVKDCLQDAALAKETYQPKEPLAGQKPGVVSRTAEGPGVR